MAVCESLRPVQREASARAVWFAPTLGEPVPGGEAWPIGGATLARTRKASRPRSSGREVLEIVLTVLLVFLLVDLAHPSGQLGNWVDRGLVGGVGISAWPLLAVCVVSVVRTLLGARPLIGRIRAGLLLTVVWVPVVLAYVAGRQGGGAYGMWLTGHLDASVGRIGTAPVLFLWLAAAIYVAYGVSLVRVVAEGTQFTVRGVVTGGRAALDYVAPEVEDGHDVVKRARPARRERPVRGKDRRGADDRANPGSVVPEAAASLGPDPMVLSPILPDAAVGAETPARSMPQGDMGGEGGLHRAEPLPTELRPDGQLAIHVEEMDPIEVLPGNYQPAPIALLEKGTERMPSRTEGRARKQKLEQTLASFGVEVRVADVLEGPTITRFEVQPGAGVKVSRILALQDDIALALAAPRVRMEAPIPGKSAVGIEVPNTETATVRLRDILESSAYRADASPVAVGLGKDVAGAPIVAALDRMPHLLIAGATGSGKSVCVNAILTSLLCRATPDRVRLILIDPKVVELGQYEGIPHLLAPVVTDPRQAAGALAWAVHEMERRYRKFAEAGARDIVRYNALELEPPLPYHVIVIDELADLMMVAAAQVEDAIARLAQMARAAGLHLVVATQRPSVDVITGLIKANIPSRIAFAVSSQVDSRTILDMGGAEKLLGRGDMLFSPMGSAKPIRAQGALVTEEEMESVISFVRQQRPPTYAEDVIRAVSQDAKGGGEEADTGDDALLRDAIRVVIEAKGASTSLLQRRLRVGYSRAGRLLDTLADRGIVGPPEGGSKPREVRLSALDAERLYGVDLTGVKGAAAGSSALAEEAPAGGAGQAMSPETDPAYAESLQDPGHDKGWRR